MAQKRRQKVKESGVTVFDPERLEAIIARSWPNWKSVSGGGEELVPLGRDPGLQDGPGLLAQRVKLPPQPPDS